MRVVVDKPVQVGEMRVTAVAKLDVEGHEAFGILSVLGHKRPLAIVISSRGAMRAFWSNGDPLSIDNLNALVSTSPDAAEALAEFCATE